MIILVIEDYIHDTYIVGGDWGDTWDWLMGVLPDFTSGDTLVDVAAKIFSGIDTALTDRSIIGFLLIHNFSSDRSNLMNLNTELRVLNK